MNQLNRQTSSASPKSPKEEVAAEDTDKEESVNGGRREPWSPR